MFLGKTLREFEALGCPDAKKTAVAARVYIDLTKNNYLNDIEKTYDINLGQIYMRGLRQGELYHVIPARSNEELDMAELNVIQEKFADMGRIVLGVYDSSGSALYYDIQNGISEMRFEKSNN